MASLGAPGQPEVPEGALCKAGFEDLMEKAPPQEPTFSGLHQEAGQTPPFSPGATPAVKGAVVRAEPGCAAVRCPSHSLW